MQDLNDLTTPFHQDDIFPFCSQLSVLFTESDDPESELFVQVNTD